MGDEWFDAPAGSFVLVPGDEPHASRTGATPGPAMSASARRGDFEQHMPGIAEWFRERDPGDADC